MIRCESIFAGNVSFFATWITAAPSVYLFSGIHRYYVWNLRRWNGHWTKSLLTLRYTEKSALFTASIPKVIVRTIAGPWNSIYTIAKAMNLCSSRGKQRWHTIRTTPLGLQCLFRFFVSVETIVFDDARKITAWSDAVDGTAETLDPLRQSEKTSFIQLYKMTLGHLLDGKHRISNNF